MLFPDCFGAFGAMLRQLISLSIFFIFAIIHYNRVKVLPLSAPVFIKDSAPSGVAVSCASTKVPGLINVPTSESTGAHMVVAKA